MRITARWRRSPRSRPSARARRKEAEQEYATARAIVDELASTLPNELGRAFQARALALMPLTRPPSAKRAAKEGYGGLTAREREVAMLIGRGLSNSEIAHMLVVSERTVESHTGHIHDKLGLSSRAQVAAWAVERGLTTNAK